MQQIPGFDEGLVFFIFFVLIVLVILWVILPFIVMSINGHIAALEKRAKGADETLERIEDHLAAIRRQGAGSPEKPGPGP